jgi:phosphatidylglycerophosphate synthase
MFVVINFLTVMWYNPNLDTDCPPWVYASCAIGLFLYQTFDAVDGMQAYVNTFRRKVERFTDTGWVLDGGRDRVARWASSLITVSVRRQYAKDRSVWIADSSFLRF